MEKSWKPRSEWPDVMTLRDLIECIPFLGRPRATAIMEEIGTRVGNNWAVSSRELMAYFDGDEFYFYGALTYLKRTEG